MKTVLFVDDEKCVVDALRLALRHDRSRWKFLFMTSPAHALAEVQAHTVDAIVSDLNMPGMDGLKLLEQARLARPGTARIILTGNVERTIHADVAHEVLSKPCSIAELRKCLERWVSPD